MPAPTSILTVLAQLAKGLRRPRAEPEPGPGRDDGAGPPSGTHTAARLTLETLARARGLDPELLRRLGWRDDPDGVAIPWPVRNGQPAWHVRRRLEKEGPGPRWVWRGHNSATLLPYGSDRLENMRQKHPEAVIIVESEADAIALWTAGTPAVAVGGGSHWQPGWWDLLRGFQKVVVWLEDAGSLQLLRAVADSRPEGAPPVYVCHNLGGPKDAGHILAGDGPGRDLLRRVVAEARPVELVPTTGLLDAIAVRLHKVSRPDRDGDRRALCPFHPESSPSLDFGPSGFKCFGCGLAGPLELLGAALGLVVGERFPPHIKETHDETLLCQVSLPFAPIPEVLAAEPQEPAWLCVGYVAPGCITLLAGRPKVGKSNLVFALLAALADGGEFISQPTRPARVVLLTEERPSTLAEKARRWQLSEHVHVLLRHQALGTPWPEVVRQAVGHAEAIGAQVLAIDGFAEWAGLPGDAENNAGAVLGAMQPLQEAAARGLAVLVVAHQRKTDGEYGVAVRGSSALTGAADIVLELERIKGKTLSPQARVLRAVGRFETTPPEVVLELTEEGYQVRGAVPEAEGAAQKQAILDFLTTVGEATADQVAEALALPRATTHKRLGELLEGGQVDRKGSGKRGDPFVWRLAPGVFVSSRQDSFYGETKLMADEPPVEPRRERPTGSGPPGRIRLIF